MKKPISTEQSDSNIQEVMRLLSEAPARLEALGQFFSQEQLNTPLADGERTPTEVLAHILHGEALTAEFIYMALTVNEPLIPDIHSERQLGKLLQLERFSFQELLAYYQMRRTMLLHVLGSLTEKMWSRVVREEKKTRKESVFWKARGLALHEWEHILDLENKLGKFI